jgi:hypothetical protein
MQLRAKSVRAARGRGARKLVVQAVAVPTKPPTAREAKRSKVEILKEKSDFLRHPLMEELVRALAAPLPQLPGLQTARQPGSCSITGWRA